MNNLQTQRHEPPHRQFQFTGTFLDAIPHGAGHINDTYAARFRQTDGTIHRYILQRINTHVFRDPEGLMHNITAITAHLRAKIIAAGGDPQRETLNLIPTIDGKAFVKTEDGQYWRAYHFIEQTRTYQVVEDLRHIYSAARAYGRFQQQLGDFPSDQLYETIPNFHNTQQRFETFIQAVREDVTNRAQSVQKEIRFVEQRAGDTAILVDLLQRGELPQRVAHNDTKLNNVLFDQDSGQGICIIDLDTVMPGLSLYDFGDAVRSAANPVAEDEPDLSQVRIDLQIFDRLVRGYLETAGSFLTPMEVNLLPFSAQLMTFENGMRFLTDYLEGDRYFKIHRPDHNLDRCRTQFKMVTDIEENLVQMERIIAQYK